MNMQIVFRQNEIARIFVRLQVLIRLPTAIPLLFSLFYVVCVWMRALLRILILDARILILLLISFIF